MYAYGNYNFCYYYQLIHVYLLITMLVNVLPHVTITISFVWFMAISFKCYLTQLCISFKPCVIIKKTKHDIYSMTHIHPNNNNNNNNVITKPAEIA